MEPTSIYTAPSVAAAPEVSIADLDRFRSDLWCFLNTLRGWKEKVDYWKVRNYYSLCSPYIPEVHNVALAVDNVIQSFGMQLAQPKFLPLSFREQNARN
jgi:hypothetical protein